jgi:hypothetical protein
MNIDELKLRNKEIRCTTIRGRVQEEHYVAEPAGFLLGSIGPRCVPMTLYLERSHIPSSHWIRNDKRYDSIWSDPARECPGTAELRAPDHFG